MNRRAKALLDCLLSLHDSPLNRLVIKRCSTEIHVPPSLVEKNLHSLRLFGFSTSRSSERAFQGCLTSSGVMTRLDFSLIRQSKSDCVIRSPLRPVTEGAWPGNDNNRSLWSSLQRGREIACFFVHIFAFFVSFLLSEC